MEILRNGKFTINLRAKDLAKGLRPYEDIPKNEHYMTDLSGLVAQDGMLKSLDTMTRIDTSVITDSFPYPQLFVLANRILVCGETKIYEYNGSLTLKITASSSGDIWKAVDFFDYIYLTNGSVVIIRDSKDGTWAESTDYPVASAVCNFNGQVLLGT